MSASDPSQPLPTEDEVPASNAVKPHDPYLAWRSSGFPLFVLGNALSVAGRQMTSMAVGWEIYRRTHSATLLGLVGLCTALPLFLFTIPSGQLADRRSRKQIIIVAQAVAMLTSIGLAALSAWHTRLPSWPVLNAGQHGLAWVVACFDHNPSPRVDRGIVAMLVLISLGGVARTFGWAARTAFVPQLVPGAALSNAITWNSSIFQMATAIGPALGGLMIAKAGFPAVYLVDAFCALAFLSLLLPVRLHHNAPIATAATSRDVLSGLHFVFRTRLVLSTMSLDLFAVLFGGATALLPIFAERLHVGSVGLGWLRAADSVGSIAMGILIAHLPPMKNAGKTILVAIAAYGFAIVGFGLSPFYWLSLLMLFVSGACDSINVVIRHTLVQVMTPENLRGRVSAVNNIFIGSSNELGAFESGLTAGLFGPVASVIGGGLGTVLVVMVIAWLSPQLRCFRSFDTERPSA